MPLARLLPPARDLHRASKPAAFALTCAAATAAAAAARRWGEYGANVRRTQVQLDTGDDWCAGAGLWRDGWHAMHWPGSSQRRGLAARSAAAAGSSSCSAAQACAQLASTQAACLPDRLPADWPTAMHPTRGP